jgi:anti-sigma factor RsiW
MKITRNVLTDLLPAYLSGEASQDTRSLIEQFLLSDAEFARHVEEQKHALSEQERLLRAGKTELTREHEVETLARTKAMLERRRRLLAVALMFTAFPLSFAFDSGGIRFLLVREQPILVVLCWGMAAFFWVLHFRTQRKLRTSGVE